MNIRPATRADSADIAVLDDIASSGLAAWLWNGAVKAGKASSALEFGRQKFASGTGDASWRNALIAEIDGDTAGMTVSYPRTSDIEPPSPPNAVLAPLIELLNLAKGTWYVDALAVYTAHRGGGVGRVLMQAEIERAKGGVMSLITEDDNTRAQALYFSLGFGETARRPCTRFSSNQTTREWLLLTRPATI